MEALRLNRYTKKFKSNTGLYKSTILTSTIVVILLAGIALSGCKKSLTDGIVFAIGTNNFKYTALAQIRDAANHNVAPGNLTVTVSGPNANLVYDLSTGKKKLSINPDGTVQLLISPNQAITGPVNFNLSVTSPGYLPFAKTITINPSDSSQVINILLRTATTGIPAGTTPGVAQFAMVNGALPHQSIVKIGADNSLHAITDIAQPISKGTTHTLNATGDGSTPGNEVTYFDDGLTSIVLPQGTTFHYWVLQPTGVIISDTVQVPHVTATTTAITGIATGSVTEYKTYYTQEVITYPQTSWVQKSLSAAASSTDSIAVVVDYATGNDITTKLELGYAQETVPTIHTTLGNQDVLQDELLFKTVVSKKLIGNPVFYKIHHATTKTWYDYATHTQHINEKVAPYVVYDQVILPDENAQWFTSFAINPDIINPNTKQTIRDGDLVEIGIDGNNNTITQTVKQVANGQLRVQMLSYDAGFFYKAPVVAPFSYTVNARTTVADPENANGYLSILGGAINFGFNGSNYDAPYTIEGKIASAYTINTSAGATGYYWNRQVFNQSYGLNGTISPFNFPVPYATVNFNILATDNDPNIKDVEVDLTAKPDKNYGAVTLYTYANTLSYGSGIINIRNGQWSTNNFPVGANVSGSSYVDGYLINLNYQITNADPNNMYWDSPKWK